MRTIALKWFLLFLTCCVLPGCLGAEFPGATPTITHPAPIVPEPPALGPIVLYGQGEVALSAEQKFFQGLLHIKGQVKSSNISLAQIRVRVHNLNSHMMLELAPKADGQFVTQITVQNHDQVTLQAFALHPNQDSNLITFVVDYAKEDGVYQLGEDFRDDYNDELILKKSDDTKRSELPSSIYTELKTCQRSPFICEMQEILVKNKKRFKWSLDLPLAPVPMDDPRNDE